ncbi:MAG: LamG domain-containing protein [Candidatus Aenigmarchaeota archaeon]|nr:LamG domain-containing protein [Candidatus Aenigmarchaeota archaeon]
MLKAQTFIITMVFLAGLIFAVQQLLLTYSSINAKQAEKDSAAYFQLYLTDMLDSVIKNSKGCISDGCLSFDGRDDIVTVNSSLALPASDTFSMLAWLAVDNPARSGQILWKDGSYGLSFLSKTSKRHVFLGSKSTNDASDPFWSSSCIKEGCLSFNGNSYINVTWPDVFNISGSLSIDVFAYTDSDIQQPGRMAIIGYRPFSLFYANEGSRKGTFGFSLSTADTDKTIYGPDNATAKGRWQHLTAMYNGTHMSLYIDGNISAIDVLSGSLARTNSTMCIGSFCDMTGQLNGRIDSLSVFGRQLSGEEIRLSNASMPAGPLAAFDFDEGFGQIAYDSSEAAQPDRRRKIAFLVYTDNRLETLEGPEIQPGRYYHVAGVYNRSSMQLYLDGAKAAEKQANGTIIDAANKFSLGGQKSFAGRLDEVKAYQKALSPQEILESMKSSNPYESQLEVYWKLDEGLGLAALDSSPKSNNGILSNFDFTSSSGWRTFECARMQSELKETEAFVRQLNLQDQAVEILYNGQPNPEINCSASLNVTIRVTSRNSVFEREMRY